MASEARMKKVRSLRRGNRAAITRNSHKASDALGEEDMDILVLRQCKRTLEEKLAALGPLDAEILDSTAEENVVTEMEEAATITEDTELTILRLTKAIEELEASGSTHDGASKGAGGTGSRTPSSSPPPPPESFSATRPTTHTRLFPTASGECSPRVKLPELSMKRFDGDMSQWMSFWDSFSSSVHENSTLSDVDKFNYLSSMLSGTAAEAIAGLSITSSNYREAVAILNKRFGNRQLIVNRHMEALLQLKPVTHNNQLRALRSLYDKIESHVRALKALGVTSDSYGAVLSSVLMSKLPSDLRLIVSRHVIEDDWELDTLMKQIEKEVEARERANTSGCEMSPPQKRAPPVIRTLLGGCCYCKQSHQPSSCDDVAEVEARKQILRKEGRCYVCLKRNHMSRECRSSVRCSQCNGKHHTSICERATQDKKTPTGAQGKSQASVQMYVSSHTPVLLQTAVTTVYGNTEQVRARIILDGGSQRSYVTNQLRSSLNLKRLRTDTVSIKTFGSSGESTQVCDVVELKIGTKQGEPVKITALSVPLICEPICGQPIEYAQRVFGYLSELELADAPEDTGSSAVDILIGSDYYWRFVTGRVRRGTSGPVAIHTKLGWVLSGPITGPNQGRTSVNLVASTHVLRVDREPSLSHQLEAQLNQFWDLESIGILSNESSVYDEFTKNISFDGIRYEVRLPWKETHPDLPDNYDLSCKRLHGLLERLRKNPELLTEYNKVIQEQLSHGIVELASELPVGEKVHYLPHHAVIRRDKETTKVRVVYDASAQCGNKPSLNHCLYKGPPFGQAIFDILLRFRVHQTALAGDIEKAFLMVSIAKKDREALRFLWVDDPTKEEPNIIPLRFTRVVFGVSASPFLLNATIAHHLDQYVEEDSEFVAKIKRAIYVDDVSFGSRDDDSTFELYEKSKRILAKGGFNLRKFITNSKSLCKRIQDKESLTTCTPGKLGHHTQLSSDDQSYSKTVLGHNSKSTSGGQKILGVYWNYDQDRLEFDLSTIAQSVSSAAPTKRDVVSITAKFFDPLGIVSPVIVQFKLLFQEMCKLKLEWDEPLTGELLELWNTLIEDLKSPTPIIVSRCYFIHHCSPGMVLRLCGFCDASTKAYAAVVYLEINCDGVSQFRFIAAKTRVSPLATHSIPRLELLAALLLSRLITCVHNALKLDLQLEESACFTDSRVALYWIRGMDREWKQFVENRVREIRRLVPAKAWKHCPGRINPADIPSRGMSLQELSQSSIWLNGPDQFRVMEMELGSTGVPEECLVEAQQTHHHLLIKTKSKSIGQILHCQNFSSLKRLQRVTAYVMKFIDVLKTKCSAEITPKDISKAHLLWVQDSQSSLLQCGEFDERTRQLNPYCDNEGIWRCKGRLSHADLPVTTRHPILLNKDHHLTTLIVEDCHRKVGHGGIGDTLVEVRSQYWIIGGRQFVRKLLFRCVICRRFTAKPFNPPPPPPLPPCRVREAYPFCNTGVDYAGPFM